MHEAMTPVTDRRSSTLSPLSFSHESVDTWVGLDFDYLHRIKDGDERGSTCEKQGVSARPANPIPAARTLVF